MILLAVISELYWVRWVICPLHYHRYQRPIQQHQHRFHPLLLQSIIHHPQVNQISIHWWSIIFNHIQISMAIYPHLHHTMLLKTRTRTFSNLRAIWSPIYFDWIDFVSSSTHRDYPSSKSSWTASVTPSVGPYKTMPASTMAPIGPAYAQPQPSFTVANQQQYLLGNYPYPAQVNQILF